MKSSQSSNLYRYWVYCPEHDWWAQSRIPYRERIEVIDKEWSNWFETQVLIKGPTQGLFGQKFQFKKVSNKSFTEVFYKALNVDTEGIKIPEPYTRTYYVMTEGEFSRVSWFYKIWYFKMFWFPNWQYKFNKKWRLSEDLIIRWLGRERCETES